jgi:hypothetical protein
MMSRRVAAALIAASLAPLPASAAIGISNPTSDQLLHINDLYRRGALRAAIIDSGHPCTRVEQSAPQGPWVNMVMWRAKCSLTDPRFDYAVFIAPDASVQVRYCAEMSQLKLPLCRPLVRRAKP